MAFILDSLRERLGSDEEGFDDLNYIVGNTSGLDIGQVPSPIDQRIGRMAQIGGSLMEIQITNPATFQIDRPELMNVINQIGFEAITLHGDPNIGFTGAYATRGQGITGYNIVHRYFKRYLEQMASFRWEAKDQKDIFDVGYVNMHASNEMIPPREEQIASDKSLDPFGLRLTEINGNKDPNIYRNKEFMELLFDFLIKSQLERYELYQIYGFFENYSSVFEKRWDKARNDEADRIYSSETGNNLSDKSKLAATAVRTDPITDEFLDILKSEVSGVPEQLLQQINLRNLRASLRGVEQNLSDEQAQELRQGVISALDTLWYFNDEDRKSGFSYEAKSSALVNHLDYERRDIEEPASRQTVNGKNMEDWARMAFAGRDEMFRDADYSGEKPPNLELFESLINQTAIGREMEKESTAFFNILPAWMQAADNPHGEREGWSVPEFIWRNVVERNASDEYDLTDYEDFQRFLEDRENELNVIAAVGVCYMWGHWTQREDPFERDAFDITVTDWDEYEKPELKDGDEGYYTWIEWMNKFGLRVNIEAMYGSPGELRRVWRPKDIAIACHAINMQAREDLDDYDENLVKFTIDLEHTASYGVDPWKEMEKLIEQEREMAKKGEIDADPEKPLSRIVKTYHLTKPGWEQQQGHRHGPFSRGDETLYYWLYHMVKNGFARNEEDEARIIFEVGGEYREEIYVTKVAMDMIQHGIDPDELDDILTDIPLNGEFETVEQELVARFFGMDKASYSREWSKVEEHAFDPLDDLLQARGFDDTFSGQGAIEQGQARPQQWKQEEYK